MYFREYQTVPEFALPLIAEMKIPGPGETVVILAPHSDDEVLGPGGFIYKSVKNGANVIVVLVTNGDGHRFSTIEEFRRIYPKPEDYINSGYARQNESKKALSILGVKEENIIFLGYPDHGLAKLLTKNWQDSYQSSYTKQSFSPYTNSYHKDVTYTGENLTNDITSILQKYKPDIVITTSISDAHPDHSATAKFLQEAFKSISQKPEVYFYLIHFNHFPNPKGLHKDRYLMPPVKLITLADGWFKVSLDEGAFSAREKAVLEYKSQLKSPFLKSLVEGFLRQNELLSKADF